MTLEVCVYCADPLAHLLSSKHQTVPASAEYSGRIIPYLFVFEAIICAFPNKVFGFRHTPNYYNTYFNFTCNIDKVIESNSYMQYCNPKIHVVLVHVLWLMHARVVNCFRQRRLVVEVVDHSTTRLVYLMVIFFWSLSAPDPHVVV